MKGCRTILPFTTTLVNSQQRTISKATSVLVQQQRQTRSVDRNWNSVQIRSLSTGAAQESTKKVNVRPWMQYFCRASGGCQVVKKRICPVMIIVFSRRFMK